MSTFHRLDHHILNMASRTRRYTILFMSGIMCILVLYQTDTMDKRLWTSFTESSSQLWYSLRLEGLRPCTCNRCAMHDDDPWFTKRFKASLNPFLTQDNALSEHDFRWWKVNIKMLDSNDNKKSGFKTFTKST